MACVLLGLQSKHCANCVQTQFICLFSLQGCDIVADLPLPHALTTAWSERALNRNLLFKLAFSSLEHRILFKYAVIVISYLVVYLLFMPVLGGKAGRKIPAGDSVNGPKHALDAPVISTWLKIRCLHTGTCDLYALPYFYLQRQV